MITPAEAVEAALAGLNNGSAIVSASHTQNLRWANSALTTNGDTTSQRLTVCASAPNGEGTGLVTLSGQVADAAQARELAAAAQAAAAAGPTAEDAMPLVDAGMGADFDRAAGVCSPELLARIAGTVSQVDVPGRLYGYAEVDVTTTYLGTSAGTRLRHEQLSSRFEMCAKSEDRQQSAWWGSTVLDPDPATLSEHLADRLRTQQDRGSLAPGRHRVLLTPSAVADLMLCLFWAAGAREAVEGHSVFSRPGGTALGEQLTDRNLTLFSDPAAPGFGSAPFLATESNSSTHSVFDNGLPVGREEVVADGRLNRLLASRATAARFDLPTAISTDNLTLVDADGHGSLEDLVERTDDAILVTCLWYIRDVDPTTLLLTGLTRDGVYRITDGRIEHSLPNFRFNVSPVDLLSRIVDAGAPQKCLPREWADWFTSAAMPALLVDGFNLSSASEAL